VQVRRDVFVKRIIARQSKIEVQGHISRDPKVGRTLD
jgi:hypothetical protein